MAYGGFINGRRRGTREEPVSKHQIQPDYGYEHRLTRDGTAEPVSRDQILRHARGQGNINFPCSADHEQDWQPYSVDPYSAMCDDHTYIHTIQSVARIQPFEPVFELLDSRSRGMNTTDVAHK